MLSGCSWGAMSQMFTDAHRTLSYRVAGSVAVVAVAIVGSLTSAAGSAALASPGHAQVARVGARSSDQPATQVHHVSPVDSTGRLKPGYRVTDSGKGYCWTTSLRQPGALPMLQRQLHHGPLLVERRPVSSLLPRGAVVPQCDPLAAHEAAAADFPRKKLPLGDDPAVRAEVRGARRYPRPWRGHDVNYLCQRHWVLLDSPDRSRPVWHILTARYLHGRYHGRGVRPLSDAWLTKAP